MKIKVKDGHAHARIMAVVWLIVAIEIAIFTGLILFAPDMIACGVK